MKILKKKIIKAKKGSVVHMYNKKDKILSKVSEVYFSNIHPNDIKAWKKTSSEQYLSVPQGQVLFVLKKAAPSCIFSFSLSILNLGASRLLYVFIASIRCLFDKKSLDPE